MRKLTVFFFLLLVVSFVSGQALDNTSSCKNVQSDNYFRYNYENDFFTATDYYYTQGVNLERVTPSLKKFFINNILIRPPGSDMKYGMSIENDGYTPTSIRHHEILVGDHPFCATLCLNFFTISDDSVKHRRISSSLTAGVIGTAASGQWMQKTIHRALKNIEPLGWENQIHNDVILNYEVTVEQRLFSINDFLRLSDYGRIRMGTLHDKASAGFTLMIGSSKGKFKFHFYDQPLINAIAYDATLQGGLFNHTSPYTIPVKDLQRITLQNNFGVNVTIGTVYLEYSQSFLTKEFSQGISHRWGGVRIGICF